MDSLPKNQIDFVINYDADQRKREALENAHGNFVEPHINQMITVNPLLLSRVDTTPYGFFTVSAWIVLTLLYCVWVRSNPSIK